MAGLWLLTPAAFGLETSLSTNFPGGNIRVIRNRGDTVELAPDLRGGRPWFYWQFEARADSTGRVRFVFPDAPQLGVQGPAVSVDEGKTWRWLGTNSVRYAGAGQPSDKSDSFEFFFTNVQERVRFCPAVPYLPRNLDEFLAGQKGNPHLAVGVLTASTKGQPVELLRVGQAAPGVRAVLVTARHHACESMASYVLEGFLKEALSESPAGAAFRSRYVLYAVPLVDKDGVLAGDQGKGRLPHDHNRDYGPTNLYPEVRAIQALAREKNVELALDFHCPAIRGESHTVFFFDGLIVPPIFDNVKELSAWLAEELPPPFSQGPLVWLKKPPVPMPAQGLPFSHYFTLQKSIRMAATLEVPYALSNDRFDAALAREYGKSLLRAWTRMDFTAIGQPPPSGHEAFLAWRKAQGVLIRSRPAEAEKEAGRVLDDTNAPELYRIEARLQVGLLRVAQKKEAEALAAFGAVATNEAATARQRAFALTRLGVKTESATPSLGADERFDWMPPEAVAEAGRGQDGGAGGFVPEIRITATPKPTADASRFTNDYLIDLKAFHIRNDDHDPVETSRGINAALQHAKTLNADRIIFPKGTYRICETNPVVIDHRNTIIDLNGATLQIQSNGLPKYTVMVVVDGAETVRVCNGFLAGDKDAHDYKAEAGTHEWGAGITFAGGRNVEADHLVISNMTGDGAVSDSTGARTRPELLARIMHSVDIKNLESGAFTETGVKTDSREKTRTLRPYDLTKCAGEFEFGYTMGYQGYPYVKDRVYQAFFYDAGTNFVGQLKCLQFRKVALPPAARFLHLEFNQPSVESSLGFCGRITNFHPPTDVHFHHNTLTGNRRLGLATCGGQRWLIEDNRFEGNGGTAPGFGVDLEDGWELMQDVVLRNNTFTGNRAGDLVICAGSELIVESNTFEKAVVVWGRPHNYIFRYNRFTGGSVGYRTRTGVAFIHDNRYENCALSIVFDTKAVADGLYRPPGKTVATPPLVLKHETLSRVKAVTGTYFCFENSRLEDVNLIAGAETRLVTLSHCELTNTVLQFEAKGPAVAVTVEACQGPLSEAGPGLTRKTKASATGAH